MNAAWEQGVTRFLQLILLGIAVFGVATANVEVVFTGLFSLLVTFLPAAAEKNYRLPLHPGVTAWLTFFVVMHAVGGFGPYDTVWWWDDVLHISLSAVIAGIGFTIVRVLDRYRDDIYLPDRFIFVFLLLFTVAAGVTWEIFEFLVEQMAYQFNLGEPIVQYSLADTMTDLLYDTAGGLLIAAGGHIYFNTAVEDVLAHRSHSREDT